ncbi:MAG TPA: type II CAAX endopeptidase family protein [Bryobacteraceae bacterium]|nr:type II CAAX endopeptidase family protein [Bryobacteraceae bacterium]HPT28924.1 type II CAAX endopeptidase family protein [Bryobacteraceae bacterium]
MSRRYGITLAVLWLAGFVAAALVIQIQHIGLGIVFPALAAVLLEASLYASLAFEEIRCRWRWQYVALLAPVPYLLYTLPLGRSSVVEPAVLILLAALAAGWFRFTPSGRLADFAFVALMAAPLIFKLFPLIYPRAHEDLRLDFLGQLLWIRAGVIAVLHDRPQRGIHFGFVPSRQEWAAGLRWFAYSLPAVLGLVVATGFASFAIPKTPWWLTACLATGTFLGIFWVVALSEEFFFRGLLQQWLAEITRNRWAGLILASVLFGSAHLGFRGFPNWRFAAVAAASGIFYGLSFEKGNGIRAAMVTHALLVTVWRALFR